jgi:hypothetical protein
VQLADESELNTTTTLLFSTKAVAALQGREAKEFARAGYIRKRSEVATATAN